MSRRERPGGRPAALPARARQLLVLVTVPVLAVALGGTAAVAFWAASGTGSGAAASGTMQPVVTRAGALSGPLLHPGLQADGSTTGGHLAVSVTNPNAFPVVVTLVQDGQPTQCSGPAVSLRTTPTLTLQVAAGATVEKTFEHVVSMGSGATDDCQGRTLTVPLTTTARSA